MRRTWRVRNALRPCFTRMTAMATPVHDRGGIQLPSKALKCKLHDSICRLSAWLQEHDYRGYDTFDGLSSRLLRPLTFNHGLLRTMLQQGVRRFPINLRPLLGIP